LRLKLSYSFGSYIFDGVYILHKRSLNLSEYLGILFLGFYPAENYDYFIYLFFLFWIINVKFIFINILSYWLN